MPIIGTTNSLRASLEGKTMKKLYALNEYKNNVIFIKAKEQGVPIQFVTKDELKSLCKNAQGACAEVESIHTVGVDEIIHLAKKKTNPIVVMLDELNDPHNLGAILRSCDAFDVSGVVYKKHGQVSLNETVIRISTGAANFVKCAEVTNLSQTIKKFKDNGFRVIGLDGNSDLELADAPNNTPILLVTGSEGFGISRLVLKNCDLVLKIPMLGKVNCLNASVACGIALYAIRNACNKK